MTKISYPAGKPPKKVLLYAELQMHAIQTG